MKKTIMANEKYKDVAYLYRVASVSVNRVTLEKHKVDMMNTFLSVDNNITDINRQRVGRGLDEIYVPEKTYSCTISDETKVGSVMQKVVASLIAEVSKRVDEVVIDFEMGEKNVKKIQWLE